MQRHARTPGVVGKWVVGGEGERETESGEREERIINANVLLLKTVKRSAGLLTNSELLIYGCGFIQRGAVLPVTTQIR